MRKMFLVIFAMSFILIPLNVMADSTSCKTTYPIVLAHGIAMNDIPPAIEYFNGVKKRLERNGATVFIADVDKMAATGTKAYQFAKYLNEKVFTKYDRYGKPIKKVNIIGHSHGGIYTKYAVTYSSYYSPKYGHFSWDLPNNKIASITQIDSPNQGSPCVDFALGVDDITSGLLVIGIDFLYTDVFETLFGSDESDVYSDSFANAADLSLDGASSMYASMGGNNSIPGIYCQSYHHKMKSFLGFAVPQIGVVQLMAFSMPIQCGAQTIGYRSDKGPHTPSDGGVSRKSAAWAYYRGMDDGGWLQNAGIDHCNATGQPFGFTGWFRAPDKYQDIVEDLKSRGY